MIKKIKDIDENIYGMNVKVIYSTRRTISIEIRTDGIVVRTPTGMNSKEIKAFLDKKKKWIDKKVKIIKEREAALENLSPFSKEEISEMKKAAQTKIPERVNYYASVMGVDHGRITIRCQRTRWGSCSAKGNLNFNCILMLFPDDVIDSVVVHELCHRKHMDHSVRFYTEVENVFPEYRRCSKWLKENGEIYLMRLENKACNKNK